MPKMQLPPGTDVWATPAGKAPSGVSNLLNPPTNENIGLVTLPLFLIIVTIFMGIRLYVQVRLTKQRLWWDDLALWLAWPPQVAFTGITMWMIKTGLVSRHIWDTPLGVVLIKLPYWTTVVAGLPQPITGLVKASLLLFYLRVFKPNRWLRYSISFGLLIVVGMYITWMFVFIFQTAFQNAVGTRLSWAQAAFNVATDVYIFCLPIYGVSRLQISNKRRLGIIAIFSTAIAAIVMSALTLHWRLEYNGSNSDPTWSATTRMTLTVLEIDIGMMCACMPMFGPLFSPGSNGRFSNFTTFFRSIRTRLLGSALSSHRTADQVPNSSHGHKSDVELVHRNADYAELRSTKQTGGREWFDNTADITKDTVYDRSSVVMDGLVDSKTTRDAAHVV